MPKNDDLFKKLIRKILHDVGSELERRLGEGTMSRDQYKLILGEAVHRAYNEHEQLIRVSWLDFQRQIEPYVLKLVVDYNSNELPREYEGEESDTSDFFEDAQEKMSRQRPEVRRELWIGVVETFSEALYAKSRKYREAAERAARHFVRCGLEDDDDQARMVVQGLHYLAFHDDVLVEQQRGQVRGVLRRVEDLDPNYLRDKMKIVDRARGVWGKVDRVGYGVLDLPSDGDQPDALLEGSELGLRVRERLEESGGSRVIEVYDALLSGEFGNQKGIASAMDISEGMVSKHLRRIKAVFREVIPEY